MLVLCKENCIFHTFNFNVYPLDIISIQPLHHYELTLFNYQHSYYVEINVFYNLFYFSTLLNFVRLLIFLLSVKYLPYGMFFIQFLF
jgi:hypothetical protein